MNTANPGQALAMSQTKLLCDTMSTLAESPVWDERRQVLFWCDILGKTVRCAGLEPGVYQEWPFPRTVSSLGLCQNGELIVTCGMDIVILDPDSGKTRLLHSIPAPEGIPCRLNDGRIGPDGAFWVGTMHNVPLSDMEPHGELWRITEKRRAHADRADMPERPRFFFRRLDYVAKRFRPEMDTPAKIRPPERHLR